VRMSEFFLDSCLVGDRARSAAARPPLRESFASLKSVFEDCGHLAGAYPDPHTVAGLLVAHAVEEWQAGRRALVRTSA
jgi:hypothetical protein